MTADISVFVPHIQRDRSHSARQLKRLGMNFNIALARKRIFQLQIIFGCSSVKCMINLLFDQRYILSPSDSLLETMLGFIPFMIQGEKM